MSDVTNVVGSVAVAICTERVEAKKKTRIQLSDSGVAICTERVEAKMASDSTEVANKCCNLHGACGGKAPCAVPKYQRCRVAICTERVEAKKCTCPKTSRHFVAICTERVEAKHVGVSTPRRRLSCNLHGACGGKGGLRMVNATSRRLQSARSVWRQSQMPCRGRGCRTVAICTERVEAKVAGKENFCKENVAICTERVEAK